MRVATDTRLLEVDPGATAAVVVEVVNTGEVIDGITARIIGIADQFVTAQPALLPLFPEASGQVTLSLAVPATHPAGRHPLTVEVVSHGARLPSQFLDVDMDVSARPALRLAATPRVLRARRGGRFILELTNEGNIPLDINLKAVDADRAARSEFVPASLRIEAGAVAPVLLTLRGPRMFTGAEIDRTVTVEASARRVDVMPDPTTEAEVQTVQEVTVRLRQRPLVSRGMLTALILASIVALWAAVFLLGLTKVFSGDPMTKQAPASFFAAANTSGGAGAGGAGGAGGSAAGGGAGGPAPAGALAKTGQLPPGMGGEITGKVVSANDKQPVGRILVQALRVGRNGVQVVSSAATQTDGTYTLAGLFPTSYFIKFSSAGIHPAWYPAATSQAGGQLVTAVAQGSTTGVNAVVKGLPASISGNVNPGNTLTPVTTTVSVRALLGAGSTASTAALASTKTKADGSYSLKNLPAPGSYELTFTTPGYQASTVVDTVSGGDKRLEPTVTLGASAGQISGTVSDGGAALGGVTVTTTVGGKALTVMTPTTGQVGAYLLGNLPTPATYVVTFSAPGHGTDTTIVDLAAGQSRAGLSISLAGGTGSVTGLLVDGQGHGLGGATVTVGGAIANAGATPPTGSTPAGTTPTTATAPTTTTLTSGSVGSFAINGLTAPGAYTLTFTLDGYAPASVPVSLTGNGAPPTVTVTLTTQLGGITGTVTDSTGHTYVGATVTATNGSQSWTATSSGAGGALQAGGYLITGLQPGSYSVTVTAPGLAQQTGIVKVAAGTNRSLNLRVGG